MRDKIKSRKIVFLTGTRADFGKLKPLINVALKLNAENVHIFATGMHMLEQYGSTVFEIYKQGYPNVYLFNNVATDYSTDITLANTINGLSTYIRELQPGLIVVHGDRIEALAGAIVGSLNNIRVAHIEGGEVSGTIDGSIRHSITKLAHIHFVTNEMAKKRLVQMGEDARSIFVIGSPEVDIFKNGNLPSLAEVKKYYDIYFEQHALLVYHPNTTEADLVGSMIRNIVDAILEVEINFVVIHPNNDLGSSYIMKEYERLKGCKNFRLFPSINFESYITLLKNSLFILGNSSTGIREAPVFGVPSINIGTRQCNRGCGDSIFDVAEDKNDISNLINRISSKKERFPPTLVFGGGGSGEKFFRILAGEAIWVSPLQKPFIDIEKF